MVNMSSLFYWQVECTISFYNFHSKGYLFQTLQNTYKIFQVTRNQTVRHRKLTKSVEKLCEPKTDSLVKGLEQMTKADKKILEMIY